MTVSRARHLGLIAMVLLGVFVYVGWRIRKDRAASPTDFVSTENTALFTGVRESSGPVPRAEARVEPSPSGPVSLTPIAIRDPSAEPRDEVPSPSSPSESTGLVDLPPPASAQDRVVDLSPLDSREGIGGREGERPGEPPDGSIPVPTPPATASAPAQPASETTPSATAVMGDSLPMPSEMAVSVPLPPSSAPSSASAPAPAPAPSVPTAVVAPAQSVVAAEAKKYTIEYGDTLWAIAQTQYGDGAGWKRIYQANRDRIPDPNRLPVGVEIVIPAPEP